MLSALIESVPRREPIQRRVPAAILSLGAHAGLLWLSVQLTVPHAELNPRRGARGPVVVLPLPETPTEPPVGRAPDQVWGLGPPPVVDRRLLPDPQITTGVPPVDLAEPPLVISRRWRTGSVGEMVGRGGPPRSGALRSLTGVDETPELVWVPEVRYPDLLLRAGITGTVVLEMVIDTAGHPEPASLRVLASPHAEFEAAARAAVLKAVYRPGRVAGRPVRVLVRLPVEFVIER